MEDEQQAFLNYVQEERVLFSKEMLSDEWWLTIPNPKRVAIEDILILYDQLHQRLKDILQQ